MPNSLSRMVVLLAATVAVFFLLLASGVDARSETHREYLVRSGDSLWAVAAELAGPGEDVRPVVHEIRRLNGLAGSALVPGQRLLVPGD